ncbi:MAG: hypothetical protein RSA98_06840 [Odoribacter sp.]
MSPVAFCSDFVAILQALYTGGSVALAEGVWDGTFSLSGRERSGWLNHLFGDGGLAIVLIAGLNPFQ